MSVCVIFYLHIFVCLSVECMYVFVCLCVPVCAYMLYF